MRNRTCGKILGPALGLLLTAACDDDAAPARSQDAGEHEHEQSHPAAVSGTDAGKPRADVASGGVGGGNPGGGGIGPEPASESDAGADDPDSIAVTIKFKAVVGDQDFACGKTYTNQGSKASSVSAEDMRLFVQDLQLIAADGSLAKVELDTREPWQSATVALLDFENGKGNCLGGTSATNTEITGRVAKGAYKGLSFVNGVPEELNHADPTTRKDPLKTSASLAWSWQAGFRFAKIEVVNSKPGANDVGRAFFHPGATACTGNPMQGMVTCARANRAHIVFEDFDPKTNKVVIDVAALFKNVDLETANECHSTPQNICDPMFDAWGINFANGASKDGQTVFRKL